MITAKLVPPDGGYAWIIASAFSLHHMIVIPLGHCFGLVFKDKFKDLGFSATDITLIVNTNSACAFWCGIINGALLKRYGYRKVALFGAGLMTLGVLMTAYADTFTEYLIVYGFITAIGMGMGISSYPLALNSYFTEKRGKAYGYAMTVSGCGAVILPQIISLLLTVYGEKGTVIMLAGLACQAFISAMLLQPLKWHLKKVIVENSKIEEENKLLPSETEIHKSKQIDENAIKEGAVQSDSPQKVNATINEDHGKLCERDPMLIMEIHQNNDVNEEEAKKRKRKSLPYKITHHVVSLLDLTLLKDITFVNIIVGISLGVFAEKNFMSLTPFIMQDYGLDTQQTATFMSMLSITDICFRFIAPYVSDFFHKPVRVMYVWSMVFLVIFRCGMLLTENYALLLTLAALIGLARGFRTIYWMLIVPSYVPIERLASAAGLQSVLNGLLIWVGAPFLGFAKDITGSFKMCVLVVNVMTFLSIIMWIVEFGYKRWTNKRVLDTN